MYEEGCDGTNTKGRASMGFDFFCVVPECAWDGDFRVGCYGVGYFSAEIGAFDLWHNGSWKFVDGEDGKQGGIF
jgi:hypothetical protein